MSIDGISLILEGIGDVSSEKEWHRKLIIALEDFFDKSADPYKTIYKYVNGADYEPSRISGTKGYLGIGTIKTLWDSMQNRILCEIAAQMHFYNKQYFDGHWKFVVTAEDIARLKKRAKAIARELNPELFVNGGEEIRSKVAESTKKKITNEDMKNNSVKMNEAQLREIVSNIIRESLEEMGYKNSWDNFEEGWYVCCVGNYGSVEVWVTDNIEDAREASMASEGSVDGPYSSYEEADYAADEEVSEGADNGYHRVDK